MTHKQHKLFRFTCGTLMLVLNVLPVSAAEIALLPIAQPTGAMVRLGDVAKIKNADAAEAARLAALPLMPSPAPGSDRFARMREVQDLLAAQGEDISKLDFQGELVVEIVPPQLRTTSTPSVDRRAVWAGTSAVKAASMAQVSESHAALEKSQQPRLTEAEVHEAENYVKRAVFEHLNRYSGRKADWTASLVVDHADLVKVLAAKTSLQCSGGVAPWTGQQRLVVAFSTERGPVRVRFVADITATQPVVVARQAIERGQIITAADVVVEQQDNPAAETGRRKRVTSLESLVGMEATRPIQAGDTVFSDDFRPQLLVKRGDEITVIARGNGIQVRTTARARQDGARGELIGVESLATKEPFEAVVSGPREAAVFTGSTSSPKQQVASQPFRKLRSK